MEMHKYNHERMCIKIHWSEIEFEAPEKPNVITAPMPKHDAGVNVMGDDEEEFDIDSWIYPTTDGGLSKWTTRDSMPISYIMQ